MLTKMLILVRKKNRHAIGKLWAVLTLNTVALIARNGEKDCVLVNWLSFGICAD